MSGAEARSFIRTLLVTFGVALAVVLAFTIVADPKRMWGVDLLPPDPENPRPLKMAVLEKAGEFDLLILGDSRGERMEPRHVRRRTGLTAFNASLTAGRIDAIEHVVDRALIARHGPPRKAIVLSGPELLIDDDPLRWSLPIRVQHSLSSETLKLSAQGLLDALSLRERPDVWQYAPDGLNTFTSAWDFAAVARRGGPTREVLDKTIEVFEPAWRTAAVAEPDRLDRVIGKLNRRDIVPVFVLMPYHPYLLERRPEMVRRARDHFLELLDGLRPERRFHVVDAIRPEAYGARPERFADGLHMDERNMRALFDHVLREVPGAF